MGKILAKIAIWFVGLWFIIGVLLFLLKILKILSMSWIGLITFIATPYVASVLIVGIFYLFIKINDYSQWKTY